MWKLPPKKQKGMASGTPDHCRQFQSSQSSRFLWGTLGEGLGGSHLWGKQHLLNGKTELGLCHSQNIIMQPGWNCLLGTYIDEWIISAALNCDFSR